MTREDNPGCFSLFFGKKRSNENDISVDHYPADKQERNYKYYVNSRFLTPAEHSFYLVALKVLGDEYMLCPQVNMAAVFRVLNKDHYISAFHRISQKRVDFIVCDAVTMKIMFGIELDDSSHKRKNRMERDEFVEKVFESALLPLLRINVREAYSTNELRKKFNEVLEIEDNSESSVIANNYSASQKQSVAPVPVLEAELRPPTQCPNCGSMFNIRVSTAGPNVGKKFYVCNRYPECKTSIRIEQ